MTWRMVYSTFIVSFSGGKTTKKLSNICSVLATFVLVQLSAPCDQLDHELISIYLIDYNYMKTFDNAGNIAPNHVSIWIWYIQFSYNVTLYLTVLCRAAPALNQNLRSRAGERFDSLTLSAKYALKAGSAFNTIYSLKAGGGRSECQIWVESGARFQHHI